MVVGLTGAIGSGKSTAAKIFFENGFETIDCDAISHEINGNENYVAEIKAAFGEEYIKNGEVDREALAKKVFSDKAALKKLTEISHGFILEITYERVARAVSNGKDVLIDAPLLFESGLNKKCDVTVCVVAGKETRLARAVNRGGITRESVMARMNNQPPSEFYSQRCDFTLKNDGTADELRAETEKLIGFLREHEA